MGKLKNALASRVAKWADVELADTKPSLTPDPTEVAGHGRTYLNEFGNTAARVGVYSPSRVSFRQMDAMERNFQVGVGVDLTISPLTTIDWSVEGKNVDEEIKSFVKAVMAPIWSQFITSCAWTGVGRGCAPHELVWVRRENYAIVDQDGKESTVDGWFIDKLKDIDPASIVEIQVDGLENFAGYKLSIPSNTVLEAEKAFHYVHKMRFGNFWGTPRLERVYEPWYRMMVLWDFNMRYMERRAIPPVEIRYPAGQDEEGNDNSEVADAIGKGMTGQDTYVKFPQPDVDEAGWDLKFMEDQQRSQMFLDQLEMHDKWILRAYMIPDKVFTQDSQTGSLALSQTHFDVWMLSEDFVLQEMLEQLNDQVIPRIVRYNFGPDAAVPKVHSPGLTADKKAMFKEVLMALINKDLVQLDVDAVCEQLGVPVPESGASKTPAAPTEPSPPNGTPVDGAGTPDPNANSKDGTPPAPDTKLEDVNRLELAALAEAAQRLRLTLLADGG